MKNLQTKLETIRGQIEKLAQECDEIEAAPVPRAEAAARIAAIFDNLPNDQLLDPSPAGLTNGTFNQGELQHMLSMPGLLVAAFPGEIAEYLLGVYDRLIGDEKPGLPVIERRERLDDIAAQVFKLEQAEEAVIEELEAAGGNVQRRPDASAIAQLGLDAA